jgi:hypothetical protein
MTNRIIERKHPIIEIFEIDAGKLLYLFVLEMFNNLAIKMLTALIQQIILKPVCYHQRISERHSQTQHQLVSEAANVNCFWRSEAPMGQH